MSTRKNLNLLLAGTLLFSVVSCGNKDKSSAQKEQNPVCAGVNCLSSINWKIVLQGRAFPDKARVDINGTTVLNECVSKQKYTIDRNSEPQQILLENFYVPKRGQLKMDVVDLGSDCGSETSFHSDADVDFEVVKTGVAREILINL